MAWRIRYYAGHLIIGVADYLFERYKFNEDMKMTKQEVKDEMKNAEGNPQIKGQIRRKMLQVSQRRMMQSVPEADVVITNPTHFAVAIKYDPDRARAPIVIAKGEDYLAQKIKEAAREHNVHNISSADIKKYLPDDFQATVDIVRCIDILFTFVNIVERLDDGQQVIGLRSIVLIHNLLHTFLPFDE